MYDSHAKRTAAERVHDLKHAMISGAWANSNFDDGKNGREQLLKKIDEFADTAIASIYGEQEEDEYNQEIDENNPFWAAAQRSKMEMLNQRVEELPE